MRKLMLAAAVVMSAALTMPAVSQAASKPTEQQLLVQKKKKAESARKAAARKLADQRKAEARKKSAKRDCDGILECLFGKSNRSRVSRTSNGLAASDYATAENVNWNGGGKYAPGSIVVRTPERALYLVLDDGTARRYKVGVGREGFQWSGNSKIVNKAEWPTWRPPQEMIKREAAKGHMLPDEMEGGPENPLGARAMYIGGTIYRIHGTNNAGSIGGAVSSGCIRMMNTDVVDLYDRVRVGARVYVYQ